MNAACPFRKPSANRDVRATTKAARMRAFPLQERIGVMRLEVVWEGDNRGLAPPERIQPPAL